VRLREASLLADRVCSILVIDVFVQLFVSLFLCLQALSG